MTPAEHTKVWRKVATRCKQCRDPFWDQLAQFAKEIASNYEQAAKEQEGRD